MVLIAVTARHNGLTKDRRDVPSCAAGRRSAREFAVSNKWPALILNSLKSVYRVTI
jgi:hypothetical protein